MWWEVACKNFAEVWSVLSFELDTVKSEVAENLVIRVRDKIVAYTRTIY